MIFVHPQLMIRYSLDAVVGYLGDLGYSLGTKQMASGRKLMILVPVLQDVVEIEEITLMTGDGA